MIVEEITSCRGGVEDIKKPEDYNQHMCGVNQSEQTL